MKSKPNRFFCHTIIPVTWLLALGTTAKADMFDINGNTAGFGVADEGAYNWLGGNTFWNTGTDAAADAGTANTATWTSGRSAYFVGAGADTHYTVRLGSDGASNVSVQSFALNVNAAANAALAGAAGNVTIGNSGDSGIMSLSQISGIGAQAGATLTINNGINLNTRLMQIRGGNVVINGVISGTGRIGINNGYGMSAGTLTLANTANTFAGRLATDTINSGYTFAVTKLADGGNNSSIGISSEKIGLSGGTLKYIGNTGAQSTNLGLFLNAGSTIDASGATSADTISFSGTTTGAAGNRWIALTGTNKGANTIAFDFGNFATGANSISKGGVGTWVLSGTNTYTGSTTINADGGLLQFAKTASLYNSDTASWLNSKISVRSNATLGLNVGGEGEFTAENVTTLLTNLTGGNGTASSGFANNSAIGFDTTNAAGGSFTVANVIANSTGGGALAVGVTKLGTGTLVLSNNSTYTGATRVSGGTLVIDGNISTSATTVQDGGTLGGSGTVGAVTIQNGGILAIGNSTGTMTYTGDLTLDLGSISNFEINSFAPEGFDLAKAALAGTQMANFDGGILNLFFQSGFNTLGTIKIFDFDAYDGDGFTTVNSSGLAGGYTASFDALNGTITVIPEPSAALLGGLGVFVLLRRRR